METGGAIGKVEEVGTDANEDVMGQIIRIRVSVDITKPLTKVIMLEAMGGQSEIQEDGQTEMQKDTQGHQYRECTDYKNQPKEELSYVPENPRDEAQHSTGILKSTVTPISTIAEKSGLDTGATQTRKAPGPEMLSKMGIENENCQETYVIASDVSINREQTLETASLIDKGESQSLKAKINWREGKIHGGKEEREMNGPNLAKKALESREMTNGLEATIIQPKRRKWNMLARNEEKSGGKTTEIQNRPIIAKRLASELDEKRWVSP
ncbi:hypothetical protein WN944_025686 [Citrus x changshan-huyou]|uniref:Uncharacterized protein n=1 Tax=Citrus x changshan-huyou TaxID=2935761 RepID=A0AAP0QCI2_9ROSI